MFGRKTPLLKLQDAEMICERALGALDGVIAYTQDEIVECITQKHNLQDKLKVLDQVKARATKFRDNLKDMLAIQKPLGG